MSMKHLIVSSVAAMNIVLSGPLFAQTAAQQNEAMVTQEQSQEPAAAANQSDSAEQYKHRKVAEATAADAKYHANRTEPNRQARDKAEAEASTAIERANGVAPQQGRR